MGATASEYRVSLSAKILMAAHLVSVLEAMELYIQWVHCMINESHLNKTVKINPNNNSCLLQSCYHRVDSV